MWESLAKVRTKRILFILMFLCILFTTLHPIPTADLWMFMTMGKHIITNRSFPTENFFSYTAPSFPVIDHEWIPELIFYSLHQWRGFTVLYMLKSAMILATFFILFKTGRKRGAGFIFCVIAILICAPLSKGNLYFDIRPYLFTYLFLSLVLYILEDFFERKNPKYLIFLLLICWVWVNSHGGFILLFILIIFSIIAQLFRNMYHHFRKHPITWKDVKSLIIILFASVLISFINPYSYRLLLYPFKFVGPSVYRTHLVEWINPDLTGEDLPFLIFFILTVVYSTIFYKKLRIYDFFCLSFFGYLAITTVRHITIFCLFSVPIVASILQAIYEELLKRPWWSTLEKRVQSISVKATAFIHFALIVMLCTIAFIKLSSVDLDNLNMERSLFPKYGVEFIHINKLPAPLFNPYEWGGYILWTLYPQYKVFVDGRINNAYPEQVYLDCLTVMFGGKGWKEVLDRYHINTVLCNKYFREKKGRHWVGFRLRESAEWRLIYEDRIEQIFVRNSQENHELILKAERGLLFIPESPWALREKAVEEIKNGNSATARGLLEEALKKDPTFIDLYVDLGFVYYAAGDFDRAKKILSRGVKRAPWLFLAHDLLGVIYEKEGDVINAKREFRKALSINPGFEHSREALRRLEGKQ